MGPFDLRTDFIFLRSCETSTHVRGLGCECRVSVYENIFSNPTFAERARNVSLLRGHSQRTSKLKGKGGFGESGWERVFTQSGRPRYWKETFQVSVALTLLIVKYSDSQKGKVSSRPNCRHFLCQLRHTGKQGPRTRTQDRICFRRCTRCFLYKNT